MKISILQGNVRNNSNTEIVVNQFIEEMKKSNIEVERIIIKDLNISHCSACWQCQDVHDAPGCSKVDDMNIIYSSVLESDCIIFASPIYSWYCTPPLKSVMDRLVYGMNKYYGETPGPSLWKGKISGIITTCGYDLESGAGVFEEGLKRYSAHSQLDYAGMLAIQDIEGKERFSSQESRTSINEYSKLIIDKLNSKNKAETIR